jgi:hypothetical protein
MTSPPASLPCRLLDACIICYNIENGAISPTVPYYSDVGFKPGATPVVFVDGPEAINAGFVAETADDWVIVAYRGTIPPFTGNLWSWITDWLNDFRIGPQPWKVGGKTIGNVESGFGFAVTNTWPAVSAALAGIDLTQKQGILVTGHSKGGGMAFPAATLIRNAYPHVPVQNCSFAAPLTCDRTFRDSYQSMGLAPSTVRYQNQYDIVPFVPYYPHFSILAAAERRSNNGVNQAITTEHWPSAVENDYVRIGKLRYLGDNCTVLTGEQGQDAADSDLWDALECLQFKEIAEAHGASGRYHTCVCG